MRDKFADTIYKISKNNSKICAIVADISPAGSMEKFRKEFPERFINCGVAEQSMIGIAAGLALKGFRPFCYTIATFAIYRPFEMIRNYLDYESIDVTVVGGGRNKDYGYLGFSHWACDDKQIMNCFTNIRKFHPNTDQELNQNFVEILSKKEPSYLNLIK
jgi:transketolase